MSTTLSAPTRGSPSEETDALVRFGAADLRRRIDVSRVEAWALARESAAAKAQLEAQRAMADRLVAVQRLQDETLAIMNEALGRPPAPAAASSAASPRLTVAGPPQGAVPSPWGSLRDALAGIELENRSVEAALGALEAVLRLSLALLLARRRASRSKVIPAAAAPTPPRQPERTPKPQPAASAAEPSPPRRRRPEAIDDARTVILGAPSGAAGTPAAAREEPGEPDRHAVSAPAAPQPGLVSTTAAPSRTPSGVGEATVSGSEALKEVDTLIAFEQFEKARALLDELLAVEPENPEYLLRHYHVRTHGDAGVDTQDEELMQALMDGPLSDTLARVKNMGKDLMPGNPLFDDAQQADAAAEALSLVEHEPAGEAASPPDSVESEAGDVVIFDGSRPQRVGR